MNVGRNVGTKVGGKMMVVQCCSCLRIRKRFIFIPYWTEMKRSCETCFYTDMICFKICGEGIKECHGVHWKPAKLQNASHTFCPSCFKKRMQEVK